MNTISNTLLESYEDRLASLQKGQCIGLLKNTNEVKS